MEQVLDIAYAEKQRREQLIQMVHKIFEERYDHQPLAYVHSFGCQQNVSDGEKIMGLLAQMGYGFTQSQDEADLILYNTCAVRENAETRVFGNVGALKKLKKEKPGLLLCLCGCMMQQKQVVEKIQTSYPFVDIIFGTHALHTLPQLLHTKLTTNQRHVISVEEQENQIVEGLPTRREGSIKAWLPIMYGCDNFCTYCIVPYVRGREKSRRPQDILAEARELVAQGYKEITLLGQNVNSYGKGLEPAVNFSKLLRMLNEIEGDFRIRFMTSHPKDCTRELLDTIRDCDKVCNHIHLPVQSGSNRILREMNRHYTKEDYLALIDYARKNIPDVAFSSDIIVGFPGETREDFLETLELIRQVGYERLYTFIYSPRTGTKAATMADPVPAAEKSAWMQELLELQGELGQESFEKMVGRSWRVLVEGEGKTEGTLTGRTESNVIVDFKAPKSLIGQFATVKVTKAMKWAVLGELIEK